MGGGGSSSTRGMYRVAGTARRRRYSDIGMATPRDATYVD